MCSDVKVMSKWYHFWYHLGWRCDLKVIALLISLWLIMWYQSDITIEVKCYHLWYLSDITSCKLTSRCDIKVISLCVMSRDVWKWYHCDITFWMQVISLLSLKWYHSEFTFGWTWSYKVISNWYHFTRGKLYHFWYHSDIIFVA